MPPASDDALSAALAGLAATPASLGAQRAVHVALLDAEVLVPRDADGRVIIDRGSPERGPSLVLFSTAETAEAWGLAADAVRVGARDVLEFAATSGVEQVALDPAGPVAVTLGSWEVRRLAVGEVPTPGSDERLAVALPAPPLPDAFVASLARAAARLDALEAVSVYEADPLRGRRHLVAGLHVAAGTPLEPLVDALHAALDPLAPDGALLDFTVVVADAPPFAALEPDAVIWSR